MITIDDPVYYEITVAGQLSFVVVLDNCDKIENFVAALSKMINKSVDWNPHNFYR